MDMDKTLYRRWSEGFREGGREAEVTVRDWSSSRPLVADQGTGAASLLGHTRVVLQTDGS